MNRLLRASCIVGLGMIALSTISTNAFAQTEVETRIFDTNHPFMQVDLAWEIAPAGLPELDPLTDHEMLEANLGRRLFFDSTLSSDGSTSCATCHQPEHGFSSPETIAKGVESRLGRRHAPTLINRRLGQIQFWDGRSSTLELQALEPFKNEAEFNSSIEEVMKKLEESEIYKREFKKLFEDGITSENLAVAISSFERTLVAGDSKIDQFVTAEISNLTKSERQGLWLYESKGGCWQCHTGQNYSDEKFHNTGVSWAVDPLDLGRFEHTKDESHTGQFKTPTLRNVGMTAPYMHDGSIKTLREVVEFYNKGGVDNPHLDSNMKPLNLTDAEVDDLVAFLKALNGRYAWEPSVEWPTTSEAKAEKPSDPESSGE